MTVSEMQNEILRLKKERDVCVLAHCYQSQSVLEVADYVGDSYGLSVQASKAPQKTVVMCGVRFMAETVKILSPEKTVYLANPMAGCPMAEQMDRDLIEGVKSQYPDHAVVCYINTTAALKTVCDVCVTSSSAVKIIRKLENPNILFVPDKNLGDYVQKQVPEKHLMLLQGGCPTHASVGEKETLLQKDRHPNALLLVHPECRPEVVAVADSVGSTSAIMDFAEHSDAKEFLIGTEMSIAEHLQFKCPEKRFIPLSKKLLCTNMKCTTLPDVLAAVRGEAEPIELPPDVLMGARRCIDRMIELG